MTKHVFGKALEEFRKAGLETEFIRIKTDRADPQKFRPMRPSHYCNTGLHTYGTA
jgi:hypothetical protein